MTFLIVMGCIGGYLFGASALVVIARNLFERKEWLKYRGQRDFAANALGILWPFGLFIVAGLATGAGVNAIANKKDGKKTAVETPRARTSYGY